MSKDLEFYKLSGAGNDFVALLAMPTQDPAELARLLCRRGLSIGADGLFVLEQPNACDAPGLGPIRMSHWNADGGAADLCLNGTRCAAQLAFTLGWNLDEDSIEILTGAGLVRGEQTIDGIRTQVPTPSTPKGLAFSINSLQTSISAEPPARTVRGFTCDTGVPHVVRLLTTEDWVQLDIHHEGAELRSHPALGEPGANVNFVEVSSTTASQREPQAPSARYTPSSEKHTEERLTPSLPIRTYERGVEGETLACGTGAVASAAVLRSLGHGNEHRFETRSGCVLTVTEQRGVWFLEGDARVVARGHIEEGALHRHTSSRC